MHGDLNFVLVHALLLLLDKKRRVQRDTVGSTDLAASRFARGGYDSFFATAIPYRRTHVSRSLP